MAVLKRIFILIMLLQFYTVLSPLPSFAFKTYHVAIVPLINTANCKDQEVLQLIHTKVSDKFKFPFYEIIPTEAVTTALQKNTTTEKVTDTAPLKELSKKLSADIIVVVELVQAQSTTITPSIWSLNDDTYVDTNVLLKCYTYSASNDKYLSLKASNSGIEPMTVDTNLYNSVGKAMDQIIAKLPYKRVPNDAITNNTSDSL
jgi:phenolic acid decarboxylase